jgi:hypothetical protein
MSEGRGRTAVEEPLARRGRRSSSALRASLLVAAAFAAAGPADAKDATSYPEGASAQTLDDHAFDVVVPKSDDAKPPYSLLVAVIDGATPAEQFLPLTKEGWVVLLPKHKFAGSMWATSETKDVHDDVDAVAAAFSIAKERMHLLAIHDSRGFATFVAYGNRRTFASVSFAESDWSWIVGAKAPPADARKRLGVLLMGEGHDPASGDPVKAAATLSEKVRTIEYRRDADPFKPYFRYWLGVMDGRFKPGYDLSFDWIADADPAAGKSDAKGPPPPAPKPALDVAKSKNAAGFVYFYAAEDAAKPEAKALQNDVFFDADVRAAAKGLVAVKLDRAKYQDAFAAFALKATPAVVVVDAAFNAVERFEGAATAKALAKSFAKAAAPAKTK